MKRLPLLLVLLLALLAVPVAQGRGTTLQLKADKMKLAYDKKVLIAKPGLVTIVMANPSPMPHNVAVKGNGVKVVGKIVTAGGRSVVTAKLKTGTYVFYCSVPGHEQAGMKGKLIVR